MALGKVRLNNGKVIPEGCPVLKGFQPGFTHPSCKECIHWVVLGAKCTAHNLDFQLEEQERIPKDTFEKKNVNTNKKKMSVTSIRLSEQVLGELDQLVKNGIYESRADAIRNAIHTLLLIETYGENLPEN